DGLKAIPYSEVASGFLTTAALAGVVSRTNCSIRRAVHRAGGDFECEVQRGDLVAGMIVRIGQLRQSIELLRLGRRSLINPRIKIDILDSASPVASHSDS